MRILTVIAICLLATSYTIAQTSKRFELKAGETPAEVLPNEAIYALPVFTKGTVALRDGSFSSNQLNYNFFLDEMQFIGPNGDTLTIAEPTLVKAIVIDTFSFYYDKGYLQEVSKADSFKLAVKQILVQFSDKTRSAYDIASGSSSITTYGSIASSSANYKLQVRKDVYFEKRYLYYLGDRFNHFVKADKKGFLNMFSNRKEALQKYTRENKINYSIKEDVEKLWQFCTQ